MAPEVWSSGVLLRGKWWIWLTWWADISSTQASWGTNVFAYAAAVSVTRVERSLQVSFSHTGLHSLWTICLDGPSAKRFGRNPFNLFHAKFQAGKYHSFCSLHGMAPSSWHLRAHKSQTAHSLTAELTLPYVSLCRVASVSGILWYLAACSRHDVGPPATQDSGWAQAS